MTQSQNITAISVNHNTSAYMELMLRSFDAMHNVSPITTWVLYDNASSDDTTALTSYIAQRGTQLQPSGYTTQTTHNSHGHLLQRGFLLNSSADYVVLLDADVVFTQPDTIQRLIAELEMRPMCWAAATAPSWDGVQHIPTDARSGNPDICDARLHPSCAVIRNTPVVRHAIEIFGFNTVDYHWPERAEYLDTTKLLTRVLLTHGLTHHVSSEVIVKHYFCTSYEWDDPETKAHKQADRDRRLAILRNTSSGITETHGRASL
ncbi:MAG: hypothetical protein ACO3F2_11625 [Roseiflexaceae bacterium]